MPQGYFPSRTKSFTRRGRDLSPALSGAFEAARGDYVVEVPRGVGLTSVDPELVLEPKDLFGRTAPLIVEVGPGRGEQLIHSALEHPQIDFLAFEVWVPGLARLVASAAEKELDNIKVIEADAQVALKTILPAASVSEMWTFFPDPWRKSKHRKRRLVSKDFANTACRILEDGALWRLATDWEDYALQMLQEIELCPDLENPSSADIDKEVLAAARAIDLSPGALQPSRGGFAPRFSGRITTHFEERGRAAARLTYDITAVRLPRFEPARGSVAL